MHQEIDIEKRLDNIYAMAEKESIKNEVNNFFLDINSQKIVDVILEHSEGSKGVLTVLVTSLFYKIVHPEQDIRYHQQSLVGGYSGRTFDTRYITPFLKEKNFPAMAESGWLTRSLEQNNPYDLNYRGSIRPTQLKSAFLDILDKVEKNIYDPEKVLSYIFQGLILKRNKQKIRLAKPVNIPITTIIEYLLKHFNFSYSTSGAARLPVLALYSVYECLMEEVSRFKGKTLLPLESHTSSDLRSGRIGDIDVVDDNGIPFEGVEIKHGIEITKQMAKDAYKKFSSEPVKRYYILSTAGIKKNEVEDVKKEVEKVKDIHGCQLIVNGLVDSLKYYLRLLDNPTDFLERYVKNVEIDQALKFEHKERWNEIVSQGTTLED